MLSPVGPGKFYGSSLPRPRYYTNATLNDERVDPPLPVLDPLLSWADEAHWSMGGRSFDRLRLQGRIEGNVNKLRAEREKIAEKKQQNAFVSAESSAFDDDSETKSDVARKRAASVSPPPAPVAVKRRRFVTLFDEDEIEEKEVAEKGNDGAVNRRDLMKTVRNLGDDFDRVASENSVEEIERTSGSSSSPMQTRSRKSEPDLAVKVLVEKVKGKNLKSGKGKLGGLRSASTRSSTRSSLRLAKLVAS